MIHNAAKYGGATFKTRLTSDYNKPQTTQRTCFVLICARHPFVDFPDFLGSKKWFFFLFINVMSNWVFNMSPRESLVK